MPGVVAVALVDVVEERQLAVRGAEQGVTYLPEVVASLLVLAPSSQITAGVEGVQKGVEIRAVVADRGEIDLLAVDDALEQILPHCGRRLGSDRVHVVPKALRGQGGFQADGMCRRRTVWENQTHMDRLLRGLIARLIAAIARY